MSHKRNKSLKAGDRVVFKDSNCIDKNGIVESIDVRVGKGEIVWVLWGNSKDASGHKRKDLINLDRKI